MSQASLPTLAPRPASIEPAANYSKVLSRDHTEAEWETMRPVIRQLYVVENRKLNETMAIMRRRHGFAAS